MFELSVALKYLLPRKKQLSVALISLMSVTVISLVVWLVLIFLSVTEGIERNWLDKLTSLNAPLRITPTAHYYSSYYYQIDNLSSSSQFSPKSISQKANAHLSDPYDPEEDGELPSFFPTADRWTDGMLKDPVREACRILTGMNLTFQDFELSGALMRLQLLRAGNGPHLEDTQNYLTQVSYLASYPDQCPDLAHLMLPPTEKDLNHLLYLASHSTELARQDSPSLTRPASKEKTQNRIEELLRHVKLKEVAPLTPLWQLPFALLPEKQPLIASAVFRGDKLSRIDIPTGKKNGKVGKLWREKDQLIFEEGNTRSILPASFPLLVEGKIGLNVIEMLRDAQCSVSGKIQNVPLKGAIGLNQLAVSKAEFKAEQAAPWATSDRSLPTNREKETGVLLAKSFRDNGVMIGDRGYLSYSSATTSSVQEHRLPIFISGFYDPGVLSIGNKCILVPREITQTINASSSSFNLDKTQSNGLLVWFKDLNKADKVKQEIVAAFEKQGIAPYWKVTTFREYDFAKDLLQQFQSDRTLFTLIGIIILLVACCNIISLLALLVNDKKKEIGILQAMGASRKSIALIFGSCGFVMGILSSFVGTIAAIITLRHLDSIVQLLSFFQGHAAFNTAFFGNTLPNQLSHNALIFILIATPLLSLIAGLVPAIKACKLRPSAILRSE